VNSIWHEERISHEDGTLAAFSAGPPDAPPVVLVHGLGHWTQAAWNGLAQRLAPRRRIVAFDLPGFGASDKPDAPYALATFRAALARVVAHFELERFSLVGHSFGGLVAADYAAYASPHVGMLALLDPAGFLRTPSLALRIFASRPAERALARLRPSRRFIDRTLRMAVYDPASWPPEVARQAYELSADPALVRAFARVYAGALREFLQLDALHARLRAWQGPTLLVWGRHDRYVPVRALVRAREVYPQATALVLERCGHCPAVEWPDRIARALFDTGA